MLESEHRENERELIQLAQSLGKLGYSKEGEVLVEPKNVERSEELDQNLLTVVEVLQKLGVPYWVNCGTLLGLVRDGRLIEWDGDVDIGLIAERARLDEIYELLVAEGFEGGRSFRRRPSPPPLKLKRPGGRNLDLSEFEIAQMFGERFLVRKWYRQNFSAHPLGTSQINFVYKVRMVLTYGSNPPRKKGIHLAGSRQLIVKSLVFLEKLLAQMWGMSEETHGYFIKYSDVFPTLNRPMGPVLTFCMPGNPEGVLFHLYGPNWKVPKQYSTWTEGFVSAPRPH